MKRSVGLSRAVSSWNARRNALRFRLASEKHCDASFGIELHDHVAHLVDDPDIVVRVDAHLGGEHESVDVFADFPHVLARAIELEHPRAAVRERPHGADGDGRMAGACIDEDVALGIGGDARDFAEIEAGGQLNAFGTESKLISGAEFWASARDASNPPASVTVRMFEVMFMVDLLVTVLRCCPLAP